MVPPTEGIELLCLGVLLLCLGKAVPSLSRSLSHLQSGDHAADLFCRAMGGYKLRAFGCQHQCR